MITADFRETSPVDLNFKSGLKRVNRFASYNETWGTMLKLGTIYKSVKPKGHIKLSAPEHVFKQRRVKNKVNLKDVDFNEDETGVAAVAVEPLVFSPQSPPTQQEQDLGTGLVDPNTVRDEKQRVIVKGFETADALTDLKELASATISAFGGVANITRETLTVGYGLSRTFADRILGILRGQNQNLSQQQLTNTKEALEQAKAKAATPAKPKPSTDLVTKTLDAYKSSKKAEREAVAQSWNEFRKANAGKGWSSKEMSTQYQLFKKR